MAKAASRDRGRRIGRGFRRPPERLLSVMMALTLVTAVGASMLTGGVANAATPARSSAPTIAWGSAHHLAGLNNLQAVSCPAAYFCAGVDSAGNAFTFDARAVEDLPRCRQQHRWLVFGRLWER